MPCTPESEERDRNGDQRDSEHRAEHSEPSTPDDRRVVPDSRRTVVRAILVHVPPAHQRGSTLRAAIRMLALNLGTYRGSMDGPLFSERMTIATNAEPSREASSVIDPDEAAGDALSARIVLLANFVALPCSAVGGAGTSRFLFHGPPSTTVEPNRSWQPDVGSLDVRVQRTWTLRRSWKHPSGFVDPKYVHIPWDTLPLLRRLRPDVVISGRAWVPLALRRHLLQQLAANEARAVGFFSERTELGRGRCLHVRCDGGSRQGWTASSSTARAGRDISSVSAALSRRSRPVCHNRPFRSLRSVGAIPRSSTRVHQLDLRGTTDRAQRPRSLYSRTRRLGAHESGSERSGADDRGLGHIARC